ncbi:MAG: hypothetical protein C0611_03975 [Desulfobacteraceae bacterium]|nr:MAG: hypothetical protein C0611_03975 [Desulfobacteraceae bacterium]
MIFFLNIKREVPLKAGIFFTGTGLVLILSTCDALDDSKLIEKLSARGIKKFIPYLHLNELSDSN